MLKIFTWHIHGTYLFYLSHCNALFYIPVRSARDEGYYGRGNTFPFGNNVIELAAEEVKNTDFDLVIFQTNKNYQVDQFETLSETQQRLPSIYIEHDPPRLHPVTTRHVIQNKKTLLVHVTPFNSLMWDSGQARVTVIDHGVTMRHLPYQGSIPKGIVMVNNFPSRGRLLGLDIFLALRKEVEMDLIGMNSSEIGGLGEVLHPQLPEFLTQYRFFFNPIRYTSLGLSVLEAMSLGLPVVALATTEMVTVIKNGVSGFIDTNIKKLIGPMQQLVTDQSYAKRIGEGAKAVVKDRFSIERFVTQWEKTFNEEKMRTHEN